MKMFMVSALFTLLFSFAMGLWASAQALTNQQIHVDNSFVRGTRTPLFYSVTENVAFTKTTIEKDFFFEICQVDYRQLPVTDDFSRVADYLNSDQAHCRRINDTRFLESDRITKIDLSQALQREVYKQMVAATGSASRLESTRKMQAGQLVGPVTFVTTDVLGKRGLLGGHIQNYHSTYGIVVSSVAMMITYTVMDMLVSYKEKHAGENIQMDPRLSRNDKYLLFSLDVPRFLKASTVVDAVEAALDRATREVSTVRDLMAVPMS